MPLLAARRRFGLGGLVLSLLVLLPGLTGCGGDGPDPAAQAAVGADSSGSDGTAASDGGNSDGGTGDGGSSDTAQDADPLAAEAGADAEAADTEADTAADPDTDAAVDAGGDTAADTAGETAGDTAACLPTSPSAETCDGVDNDCDGTTDQPSGGAPGLCDDGNACTTDACVAGKCVGGPGSCDDGNPCTDDACEAAKGCSSTAKTGACDDGNACTQGETCTGGVCAGGEAKTCDDGNSCTVEACAPATGCASVPCVAEGCGKGCSDGDPCTAGEGCSGGTCQGGVAACNDGDACTSDACNAQTGACSHAPVPACKACATAADCADGNDCTTDACSKGLCQWTSVAGCVGPTDPFVSKLQLLATTVQAPGGVLAKLYVTNYGKPIVFTGTLQLKFERWLSKDAVIDAGDVTLGAQAWTNKAVGAPAYVESYMDVTFAYEDLAKVFPGPQFACIRLVGGGDVNTANNDACAPVDVKFPVWKLAALGLPAGDTFAGVPLQAGIEVQNGAAVDLKVPIGIYLSQDATWDAQDAVLQPPNPGGNLTVKAGAKLQASVQVTIPVSTPAGKPWICVVLAPNLQKTEQDFSDNVQCQQLENFRNPVDVGVDPVNIVFRNPAGTLYGNPPFGQDYTCHVKQIANIAYQPVKAPLAVRCWVDGAGKAWPGDGDWALEWATTKDIAAGYWQNNAIQPGKLDNVFSVGVSAKLRPKKVGVSYVCAHLDPKGTLDETALKNNNVCGKITVLGHDLFVDKPYCVVGGPVGQQPATLKREVPLALQIRVCNKGNAVLTGATKLKTRLLLSKDGQVSADDIVAFDGTGLAGYTKIDGANSSGIPGCANLFVSDKVTLPASVPPGAYTLLWDVNHDQAYPDPEADNAAAGVGVTVQ